MRKHYETNHPELTEKQVNDPKNYIPHLRKDYEFYSHDLPTRKREFLTEESRYIFFEKLGLLPENKFSYNEKADFEQISDNYENKVTPKDPLELDENHAWKS